MGTSLPFPAHKHPPRLAGIIAKAGSAASQATAAAGEDQGTAGNGAPTGTDSGHLDHRRADHKTEIHGGLRRQRTLPSGYQRYVETCPAHVAGDDVWEPRAFGDVGAGDDAGCGAR